MPNKSRCHYHYVESEEVGIVIGEDGLGFIERGPVLRKWSSCGHIDFPLDVQDTNESNLKEKRNYPTSPDQLYMNYLDVC